MGHHKNPRYCPSCDTSVMAYSLHCKTKKHLLNVAAIQERAFRDMTPVCIEVNAKQQLEDDGQQRRTGAVSGELGVSIGD